MPRPINLQLDEIATSFATEPWASRYPPLLTIEQLADLFQVSKRTAYQWIAEGLFDGAISKSGTHRRVFRDRAVQLLFGHERHR